MWHASQRTCREPCLVIKSPRVPTNGTARPCFLVEIILGVKTPLWGMKSLFFHKMFSGVVTAACRSPIRASLPAIIMMAPPPIASRYFSPLGSPANYTQLIESAPSDTVSVIKFQAPYCRTCRKTSPLLDRVAKQYPQARFYSMDLVRDGKAAGERVNRFFKEKGVKLMPYVEVYIGSELFESEVVPPSAVDVFEQSIGAAVARIRAASTGRGGSRQLVMLRRFLRGRERPRKGATSTSSSASTYGYAPPAASSPSKKAGVRGEALALWQRAVKRSQATRAGGAKRGAPLRGATGGRRKGWR
jgi:thiol-disulfide isomerase/thioredoxin